MNPMNRAPPAAVTTGGRKNLDHDGNDHRHDRRQDDEADQDGGLSQPSRLAQRLGPLWDIQPNYLGGRRQIRTAFLVRHNHPHARKVPTERMPGWSG